MTPLERQIAQSTKDKYLPLIAALQAIIKANGIEVGKK